MALHHALYHPETLVLVLSPSLRQSSEFFKKVSSFYRAIDKPIPSEVETVLKLELENGSRIISLPGQKQTIRRFSGVSLLIIDEAARVADDLFYSVRPMLAVSRGAIIPLSTPHGKRGFLVEEWQKGEGWQKIRIIADQCPRISKEFLEEERKVLGDYWLRQEYFCEFAESQTAVFRYESIMNMVSDDVEYWDWLDDAH